jgi:hypothetical protein
MIRALVYYLLTNVPDAIWWSFPRSWREWWSDYTERNR